MEKKFYYEIAVGSLGLKHQSVFTYSSYLQLSAGQLVKVELKHKVCLGVVIKTTTSPKFKAKEIIETYGVSIPRQSIELMLWAQQFYPGESGAINKLFLPPNITNKAAPKELVAPEIIKTTEETLTDDQKSAIKTIGNKPGVYLLNGSTGSGKTRVYIDLAKQTILSGRSVMILSPEIGLSEQMQNTLLNNFTSCVSYHSLFSAKDRRDIWLALAQTDKPKLITGPRSALFLPLSNIGLIVIDEAHDSAYKQLQSPYYSTLQIATKLAQIHDAALIYGSATPNTSDYYAASQKQFPIINMTERPVATRTKNTTEIIVVDAKDRGNFRRNNFISDESIAQIKSSVQKGMQSLILLNRRGTAQLLQCETCAWQYRCPQCDHTLVYHRDKHKAICHYCGSVSPMLTICPEDKGSIKQFSVGTKHIEETCKSLFPTEVIKRIDRDSVEKDTIKDTMLSLSKGDARILVGTQLLAKGLDLPLLNTVVVLEASPKSSDFLGDERYYQLLHQVLGRGMRGHQNTKIIIQAPDKNDRIIDWAKNDDWKSFYEHELEEREKYHYPPFVQLAVIRFSRKNASSAEKIIKKIQLEIKKLGLNVEALGPLPTRASNKNTTNWVILFKARKRSDLIKAVGLAPVDSTADYDPIGTQ